MKKIDLHLHTVPTIHEASFDFDLEALKRYVDNAALDAIAITNHNIFDAKQFSSIQEALDIVVFPGIEVSIENGHILIICDNTHLKEFENEAEQVRAKIKKPEDRISTNELLEIFPNLHEYIVIPHYLKKPIVKRETLDLLSDYITSGEVDCAKKFIRSHKDESKLVPLLFSDARMTADLSTFPTRQTFVDCGELTLTSLKICLQDRTKVALSKADGNNLFQVLSHGQSISTGLNVLLGARSSGKTYTLDNICSTHDNVKYIKQFSLVQQNEEEYNRQFNKELSRTRSQFIDKYLSEFKNVLNDIMHVDLLSDEQNLDNYFTSLLEAAEEADKKDSFSKTALFDESVFSLGDDKVLDDLIASTRQLIENVKYRDVIDKHIKLHSLKMLAIDLIEIRRKNALQNKKKRHVNSIVNDVKQSLQRRTSATQIKDIDLYQFSLNKRKVSKFNEIVKTLQQEAIISEEHIQGFRVVATKEAFIGAGEIQKASGTKAAFSDSFKHYSDPYHYLQSLKENTSLSHSELYRLFTKISYKILNSDGFEVSGGERSEFRLLQEIKDSQRYDILLIDEPESSFDNIFLRSDVNKIIKEVSTMMPVVVVTHNNTIGASIAPDYLIYASKEQEGGELVYRLYSGYPSDLTLHSQDGKTINTHEITLNALEAGRETYDDRRQRYDALKN